MLNVSITGYAGWLAYDTFLIVLVLGRPIYDPNPLSPILTQKNPCQVHVVFAGWVEHWHPYLFLCFQRPQTMKGKRIFQGALDLWKIRLWQFALSHLWRLLENELLWGYRTSIIFQKTQEKSQSLKICKIDLSWHLHTGHVSSQFIPLATSTSLTGTLLCMHSQKKWIIFESISSFQIQWPWKGVYG